MRVILAACALLAAQAAFPENGEFDRPPVMGVSRAYLESYLRLHKSDITIHPDWDSASAEFVPFKHGIFSGYAGVFVPESVGTKCLFANFDVEAGGRGYSRVLSWGVLRGMF